MPNFDEELDFEISLDEIIFDNLRKGKVVRELEPIDSEEEDETVQYAVMHMRECMKEIYQLYSKPNVRKRDFVRVLEKHRKRRNRDIDNFLDTLEREENNIFQVIKRRTKGDEITVTFKKMSGKTRIALIKSIAKKLASKLTNKQIEEIMIQGMKTRNKLDNEEELKKIDKKLDEKELKVEGKRGCYRLIVDDYEIMVI